MAGEPDAMTERKTALTFEEKITVAFMHYVRQIDQQDLAVLYGVNGGRVNEACLTVKNALVPPVLVVERHNG
jgi:hypothetical protein